MAEAITAMGGDRPRAAQLAREGIALAEQHGFAGERRRLEHLLLAGS